MIVYSKASESKKDLFFPNITYRLFIEIGLDEKYMNYAIC